MGSSDSGDDDIKVARLPLVLGVTGHRALASDDLPLLRRHIEALIDQLQARYPHTPLQLVSPLAEGADRLVAEVALARGVELIVPLPFAQAEYERDFPDSVAEFRRLLAAAAAVNPDHVFTLPPMAGATLDDLCQPGHVRNAHYAQVGAYVVAHCHILLALWDGTHTGREGGTGQVVEFRLQGLPQKLRPDANPLDRVDTGPVYHIPARRADAPPLPSTNPKWLYPEQSSVEAFESICGYLDQFNRDAQLVQPGDLDHSISYLLPEDIKLRRQEARMRVVYGLADRLALKFRTLTRRTLAAILLLAASMALAFETYAHLIVQRPVLALYLLCFAGIVGLYYFHRRVHAQSRYLDYRALAEGLRVQLFWRLAGLPECASAHYLQKQNDELQWIREAIRGMGVVPAPQKPALRPVCDHWINGQAIYFARSARRDHDRFERLEGISNVLYGSGLFASIVVVAFWGFFETAVTAHHILIVFMGFTPVVGALGMAYAEKTALNEQSKQYARMALIFGRAKSYLEGACAGAGTDNHECTPAVRALILRLGKEALMENGDWVLLHRERPVDIPRH